MKWTEKGIEFEGTPDEFLAVHRNGCAALSESAITLTEPDRKRTHAGKAVYVTTFSGRESKREFRSILDAVRFLAGRGANVTGQQVSGAILKYGDFRLDDWRIEPVRSANAKNELPGMTDAEGEPTNA